MEPEDEVALATFAVVFLVREPDVEDGVSLDGYSLLGDRSVAGVKAIVDLLANLILAVKQGGCISRKPMWERSKGREKGMTVDDDPGAKSSKLIKRTSWHRSRTL